MTGKRKKQYAEVILRHTDENGVTPKHLERKISEIGISADTILRVFLQNPELREPIGFLKAHAGEWNMDQYNLRLLVKRISKKPVVSEELINLFLKKDKNFENELYEEINHIFDIEDLSIGQENNLFQFLKERRIAG